MCVCVWGQWSAPPGQHSHRVMSSSSHVGAKDFTASAATFTRTGGAGSVLDAGDKSVIIVERFGFPQWPSFFKPPQLNDLS